MKKVGRDGNRGNNKMKNIFKKPTAWKFVFKDGRFFSCKKKSTVEIYATAAYKSFGKNCGRIEPMYEYNPYIVEGRE